MGRSLVPPLALVGINRLRSVDGEALVGVDGYAEESGVGLQRGVNGRKDIIPKDVI